MRALDESMWILLSAPTKVFLYYFFLLLLRFAETEEIAVLATLVSQYKFKVKEEPQFANETFEERKSRILSVSQYIIVTYVLFFFTSILIKNGSSLPQA